MGAACCIAARDKDFPSRTGCQALHRNSGCSPTLSFRWDNRRRVAGENEDSSCQMSHGVTRDAGVEIKGTLGSGRDNLSGGLSPLESFGTPMSPKSPVHEGMGVILTAQPSDLSMESNYPMEVKSVAESPDIADLPLPKISYSVHSSFSTPTTDPFLTCGLPLPPCSTPSRRARRSPGHRLLRQISDSRILGLKSPNNYSLHDLTMGSHGGSSDGWSMRTFSELVATSQRGRWSFDSEHFGSGFGKISGCSSRFSCSPSLDLQTCGACSKFLTEKSVWSSQRIISTNDLPVVAVLACGHAYHAECLEATTLEVDKYDPACPTCEGGEKQILKMSKKALRTEADLKAKSLKISRNRVIDSYFDSDSDDFYQQKDALKDREAAKLDPGSGAASSSVKPFLRRRFTFGSKWSRTLSEKKGFWARHRKD
ncbi:Zinc finger, RING-type [Salix suchowensis]|nr:Zinc finger, RING-type [Salix suchowensis]